jgi:hypothetical protein
VIEDRRIGSEPAHREVVDIVLERAALQKVSRNVVEPDTLAQIVEQLCCFHRITWFSWPDAHRQPGKHRFGLIIDDESSLKGDSFSVKCEGAQGSSAVKSSAKRESADLRSHQH